MINQIKNVQTKKRDNINNPLTRKMTILGKNPLKILFFLQLPQNPIIPKFPINKFSTKQINLTLDKLFLAHCRKKAKRNHSINTKNKQ
jgi:hypothetical protein